ncbi:MAG: DEAD/DEAH box helicase [Myxococcota bacterium]
MQYRGFTLDRFQREAIEALQAGDSVLVCAPTGTGKTVVADWVVERSLDEGRQVIYTAPIKALSNQKFRDYCALVGEDNTGLVTGDLVIRRDAPCRVMTTEILRNILLTGEQIPDLAAVIIDEIHFLDDPERGTTWEEVLIYLPPHVQIVGLSATLSNLTQFAEWLSDVRERNVQVIEEHQRAVPLTFRLASRESGLKTPKEMDRYHREWQRKNSSRKRNNRRGPRGRGRKKDGEQTSHVDVFEMLQDQRLFPFLYFVFSRKLTEKFARQLGRYADRHLRGGLLDRQEADAMDQEIEAFYEQQGADDALDERLAELYRMGIAFHHAGLNVLLKAFVEMLYEKKLIKVLYCTGTFALGINMPARTAVFDGLTRYNGREMIPLPTREFMQMAGRAGRRGLDDEGLVVIRTHLDDYREIAPQLKGYLNADYEPVYSRFSLSFNSVVNLLHRHPPDRIRELVEKSFLSFFREKRAEMQIDQAVALEQELKDDGWSEGDSSGPPAVKRKLKMLKKLRRRARSGKERTWQEFEEKVGFLVDIGYLSEDLEFNAGAKALMHVQIQEIFTTEMVLQGLFEDLSPAALFGVLCGMTAELPRGVVIPEARRFKRLGKTIEKVRYSEVVVHAEELSGLQAGWDFQLIPIGKWWAEGRSMGEIMLNVVSPTDISGSLVGAFRRAKDLAGQLSDVWVDFEDRTEMLRDLIRSVSRDEVEVVD